MRKKKGQRKLQIDSLHPAKQSVEVSISKRIRVPSLGRRFCYTCSKIAVLAVLEMVPGQRTLAVDEEPEVLVGVVLLELLHGDLLGLGHVCGFTTMRLEWIGTLYGREMMDEEAID
jgi:hypothetical protein